MHQIKSRVFIFICTLFFSSILFTLPVSANNNANTNNSTLSVSSTSIPADGSATATISITVRDDQNNAISGDTVTLTSTGDTGLVINGGTIGANTATATTGSSGNVSFKVSSNNPNPGTDTFTAADTSDNPAMPLGSNNSVAVTFTKPGPCNYNAPGSTPKLTSAVANGTNQITLTWTDASDPVSYYLLAYGITSGQYIYGNPNIGGQGITSYTVSNLAKGTTYYFAIKAVNGCTPGNFSNEVSATTTGGVVVTPATPADTSSNNQNDITPTDTPIPSPTTQPTATATPTKTLTAGISKTQMLIYILILVVVIGGTGNFIYWRRQKNTKEENKTKEEITTENFS